MSHFILNFQKYYPPSRKQGGGKHKLPGMAAKGNNRRTIEKSIRVGSMQYCRIRLLLRVFGIKSG
jgi:hypothetical protein